MKIQFESLYEDHWSPRERENVELIADFVQHLMNDHDFQWVLDHHGANSSYVQHNTSIPDGIAGLVGFVRKFAKSYPEYSYDVKRIMADGDLVMFHTHATVKAKHRGNDRKGMIIIDYWRVKDGLILEHWDSIQTITFWFTFMLNFFKLKGRQHSNGSF